MAPSPLPDVKRRLCSSQLIDIHESFCTLMAKTKTNLSIIAGPCVTSTANLHCWIDEFGLACLLDLLHMPLPFWMKRSAFDLSMMLVSSVHVVELHFHCSDFPIANNLQPHLACSGALKDRVRIDSMNASWQTFHGRDVALSFCTNGFHLINKTW